MLIGNKWICSVQISIKNTSLKQIFFYLLLSQVLSVFFLASTVQAKNTCFSFIHRSKVVKCGRVQSWNTLKCEMKHLPIIICTSEDFGTLVSALICLESCISCVQIKWQTMPLIYGLHSLGFIASGFSLITSVHFSSFDMYHSLIKMHTMEASEYFSS